MTLEDFLKANKTRSMDMLHDVRNGMFDSQYEILAMINKEWKEVEERNESRKKAASHNASEL